MRSAVLEFSVRIRITRTRTIVEEVFVQVGDPGSRTTNEEITTTTARNAEAGHFDLQVWTKVRSDVNATAEIIGRRTSAD